MALSTQNFTTLVQNWASAVQSSATQLLDFTVGSILRAIAEAQAGVALWLQGLILQVLATTCLATSVAQAGAANSVGPAVDSFIADFGLTRIPAISAQGTVTFSRVTPTNAATIPVGAFVQTADGTQTYTVVADPTNGAYSAALNAYVVNASVGSVDVTVQAVNSGAGGNVSAGTITVMQTGVEGIDTVANGSNFTTGINAETNGAIQARFVAFINSLSKGTDGAIAFAITSVQANLQYTINENIDLNNATDYGQVTVVIDDGSGNINSSIVAAVQAVMQGYRAAGIRVSVYAATTLTASAVMTITVGPGYVESTVEAQVQAAIASYLNNVGLANPAPYTRLAQVAYDTSPGVIEVATGYTLNGTTADLVPTFAQTIKAGTVTVN